MSNIPCEHGMWPQSLCWTCKIKKLPDRTFNQETSSAANPLPNFQTRYQQLSQQKSPILPSMPFLSSADQQKQATQPFDFNNIQPQTKENFIANELLANDLASSSPQQRFSPNISRVSSDSQLRRTSSKIDRRPTSESIIKPEQTQNLSISPTSIINTNNSNTTMASNSNNNNNNTNEQNQSSNTNQEGDDGEYHIERTQFDELLKANGYSTIKHFVDAHNRLFPKNPLDQSNVSKSLLGKRRIATSLKFAIDNLRTQMYLNQRDKMAKDDGYDTELWPLSGNAATTMNNNNFHNMGGNTNSNVSTNNISGNGNTNTSTNANNNNTNNNELPQNASPSLNLLGSSPSSSSPMNLSPSLVPVTARGPKPKKLKTTTSTNTNSNTSGKPKGPKKLTKKQLLLQQQQQNGNADFLVGSPSFTGESDDDEDAEMLVSFANGTGTPNPLSTSQGLPTTTSNSLQASPTIRRISSSQSISEIVHNNGNSKQLHNSPSLQNLNLAFASLGTNNNDSPIFGVSPTSSNSTTPSLTDILNRSTLLSPAQPTKHVNTTTTTTNTSFLPPSLKIGGTLSGLLDAISNPNSIVPPIPNNGINLRTSNNGLIGLSEKIKNDIDMNPRDPESPPTPKKRQRSENGSRVISSQFDQIQEVEIESSKIQIEKSAPIGSGSFGNVYQAKYGLVPVAVKQLNGQFAEEAFLKEVRALRTLFLSHPSIIRWFGVSKLSISENQPKYCFVFDLYELNASDQIRFNYNVASCKIIVKSVASALVYLHDKGIVHRDIAGRNVFCIVDKLSSTVSKAALGDFGLARVLEKLNAYNIASPVSIFWSAPECLRPLNPTADSRSDVYSFGVLVWELFSGGLHPYQSSNTNEAKAKILNGETPDLQKLKIIPDSNLRMRVEELVRKCWVFEPTLRPTMVEIEQFCQKHFPEK